MGKKKTTYQKKKSILLRIFIVSIAVLMLVGIVILPLKSFAANEDSLVVDNFETGKLDEALRLAADGTDYNFIKNVAVLSGTLNASDYNALTSIPNIEYLELAKCDTENNIIPENAIPSRNQLKYISLPKNTETIGVRAFSNNKKLVKVSMPSSVTKIDTGAFESCEVLSDIPISENVTYIGESAFRDCKAITEFILPSGVTEIFSYTFSKCGFSDFYIGPNVTKIGDCAFGDCNNLKNIYAYGKNAPSISGQGVFQNVSASIHVYEDSADSYKSWEGNNLKIAGDLSGKYTLTAVVPEENEAVYTETAAETEVTVSEDKAADSNSEISSETEASITETAITNAVSTVSSDNTGFTTLELVLTGILCAVVGAVIVIVVIKISKSKKN